MYSTAGILRFLAVLVLSEVLLALGAASAAAQSIDLSGYVKAETVYDTRQVLQVREGHLHLYPLPEAPEADTDNLLLNAFQSRVAVTGAGTQAWGADVTGVLEADFFGVSNDDVNGLRLRHAFVKLSWAHHEVLAGQYWSPLFSPSVLGGVQSSSAGAPFQPFARFTQVRYTWKPGRLNVVAALSQQRDAFSSIGGSKAQQQAGLPGAHLHAEYRLGEQHLVGAGLYAKELRPLAAGERFGTWAAQGYGRFVAGPVTARAKLTFGYDLTDHLMTGGYVQTLSGDYEALGVASGWIDLEAKRKALRAGLFAGYTTNLGTRHDVHDPALAKAAAPAALGGVALLAERTRAPELEQVWRLAPRLVLTSGQVALSCELELTSALYASTYDRRLKPAGTDGDAPVTNVRTLISAFYFF